ncbi:coiled-coil domain-containing protein 112-like [Papilio machaon]|uniref:coiled-coil domain-containing protein 112-like n=1 Tax=Papilio machaon TaxID=76193 RepID=UPI001E663956|nr:coiled-coil domain-containing protein 112-like [Papilio machaon]
MSKTSKNSDETNGTTLAKLRRLKIQENVLASSINKSLSSLGLDEENFTNIDEVKRDVLGLEEKLRTFKSFLRSELNSLKISAKEIQQQLLINQKEKKVLKNTVTKTSAKKFNEIVPSPVRILRNSPFKCPEVQRFQEFVTSSKRYNGWNEYNYNIFIQIWNKYFHSGNGEDVTNIDDGTENTEQFHQFKNEVMAKISGISYVDIKSHYKWYSQYVYLKNKQQEALEKWKENKQKLRKPGHEVTLKM